MRLIPLPNPLPRPQPPRRCVNCGAPESSRFCRGRCAACYQYRRRNGDDRIVERVKDAPPTPPYEPKFKRGPAPERLICDCGEPAVEWLPIVVGGPRLGYYREETLSLCETCAALERRLSSKSSW
jgi:hypothetical protein